MENNSTTIISMIIPLIGILGFLLLLYILFKSERTKLFKYLDSKKSYARILEIEKKCGKLLLQNLGDFPRDLRNGDIAIYFIKKDICNIKYVENYDIDQEFVNELVYICKFNITSIGMIPRSSEFLNEDLILEMIRNSKYPIFYYYHIPEEFLSLNVIFALLDTYRDTYILKPIPRVREKAIEIVNSIKVKPDKYDNMDDYKDYIMRRFQIK